MAGIVEAGWSRITAIELPVCRYCYRLGARTRRFFAAVSRLGNGHYWYLTAVLAVALSGTAAIALVGHVLIAGAIGLFVYRLLKRSTHRARPCDTDADLAMTVAPLDRYSFPSGHTLQAVLLATIVVIHLPPLAPALIVFAALTALSRVVLGLHYPTDVVAGAALGVAIARTVCTLLH